MVVCAFSEIGRDECQAKCILTDDHVEAMEERPLSFHARTAPTGGLALSRAVTRWQSMDEEAVQEDADELHVGESIFLTMLAAGRVRELVGVLGAIDDCRQVPALCRTLPEFAKLCAKDRFWQIMCRMRGGACYGRRVRMHGELVGRGLRPLHGGLLRPRS